VSLTKTHSHEFNRNVKNNTSGTVEWQIQTASGKLIWNDCFNGD